MHRSARYFWLVQLSSEMWEYADDGELYFEKVLGFIGILLDRWKEQSVSHNFSIIFFSVSLVMYVPVPSALTSAFVMIIRTAAYVARARITRLARGFKRP